MIFIYLKNNMLLISRATQRELRDEHGMLEVMRMFRTIQDARSWVGKQSREVLDLVPEQYTGITPAGRERMRERKRGKNNPNASGLSAQHRQNISRNKKKMYLGEGNPMYNRHHTRSARLKIGLANIRRKNMLRWAVDASGREHMLPSNSQLPPGWAWGRNRHSRSF
jgi:hypothetical protein